jgi:hypothetical protein
MFAAFSSMVVGALPIFFIPSVLKGSFSALGSVGSRLAGLGDRLGTGVSRGIRGSEGYKAAQARGYARANRIRAGLDRNYKPTAIGNLKSSLAESGIGKALGYGALQRSRIAAARKDEASQIEGDTMLGSLQREYEQTRRARAGQQPMNTERYLRDKLEGVAGSSDDNAKFSVIDEMIKAGVQSSHIAQITRDVFGRTTQNQNFLENFASRYGGGFLRKDFEQLNWASRGGVGDDNVAHALGTLGEPDRNGIRHVEGGAWAVAGNMRMDDMKDEDVAALSSERLFDMMNAGLISQSQAQRVWASNTNMDDTNRLMMGAYGNTGMMINKFDAQQALSGTYNGTAAGLNDDMRKAYTERAAMDTRIRDVNYRNERGEHRPTDAMLVDTGGVRPGETFNVREANEDQTRRSPSRTRDDNRPLNDSGNNSEMNGSRSPEDRS